MTNVNDIIQDQENRCELCSCYWFTYLGKLGQNVWIRCRACGQDQMSVDPAIDLESTD